MPVPSGGAAQGNASKGNDSKGNYDKRDLLYAKRDLAYDKRDASKGAGKEAWCDTPLSAMLLGRLWFQVSRYSGRVHVQLQAPAGTCSGGAGATAAQEAATARGRAVAGGRDAAGRRDAATVTVERLGVTLDAVVLEAEDVCDSAVADWVAALPMLPTLPSLSSLPQGGTAALPTRGCVRDKRGNSVRAGTGEGAEMQGEDVWRTAKRFYEAYLRMPAARRRIAQSGEWCCRLLLGLFCLLIGLFCPVNRSLLPVTRSLLPC